VLSHALRQPPVWLIFDVGHETMKITEEYLVRINEQYREKEIPPIQRPFRALSHISREFSCSISFSSPIANQVFDWFAKNSKPGSHAIGSLFTGAFYYDACFWPLSVPIGYGTFRLNALNGLDTMPDSIKSSLMSDHKAATALGLYWADCIDYAYGVDELTKSSRLSPKALSFIESGHHEFIGALSQLTTHRPNTKAILNLRMASEIFLKAFLIQERSLGDAELKKMSHKITEIAAECEKTSPIKEFGLIKSKAHVYPDVSTRYEGANWTPAEVWTALCLTQVAATAVIRFYTGSDLRPQITQSK
jgi:hypothetical protein